MEVSCWFTRTWRRFQTTRTCKRKKWEKIVEGVENVDGTPSHGKTLDDKKIPKKVRDKARNTPEYQKQKKD